MAAAVSRSAGPATSVSTRCAPSAAKRSATARPMPLAAPVIERDAAGELALGLLQLHQLERPVLELHGVGVLEEAEAAQRLGRLGDLDDVAVAEVADHGVGLVLHRGHEADARQDDHARRRIQHRRLRRARAWRSNGSR